MSDVFTFAGIGNEAMGLTVTNATSEPLGTPLERVYQDVPGRDGSYPMGTKRKVRAFTLPVALHSTSDADAQTKLDAIATWLNTDAPAALTFVDRPDSVYYAQVDGEVTLSRQHATYRTGTLTFVCPDPHRYASTPVVYDIGEGDTVITNPGGLPIPATLDLTFATPATFVRAECGGMFCGVGDAAQPDASVFVPESVMLHDDCSAVWGASSVGAPVTGAIATNGSSVSPKYTGGDWGTASGWHGPSGEIAFPQVDGSYSAQDFTLRARVRLDNRTPSNADELKAYNAAVKKYGKSSSQATTAKTALDAANKLRYSMGAITLYALDASRTIVASARVGDMWEKTTKVSARFEVAGKSSVLLDTTGPKATSYNNFDGIVELTRKHRADGKGTDWSCMVCRVSGGKEVDHKYGKWTDKTSATTAPIMFAAMHFGAYGTVNPVAAAWISQVDVTRHNIKVAPTDPEHIVEPGDVLTFEGWDIRKNGAPYTAPVDFGSDLVLLPPGDSTLTITTDGDLDSATATIHPAWL